MPTRRIRDAGVRLQESGLAGDITVAEVSGNDGQQSRVGYEIASKRGRRRRHRDRHSLAAAPVQAGKVNCPALAQDWQSLPRADDAAVTRSDDRAATPAEVLPWDNFLSAYLAVTCNDVNTYQLPPREPEEDRCAQSFPTI